MTTFVTNPTDARRQKLVVQLCWAGIIAVCVILALSCRTATHGGTTGDFPVFYWSGVRLPLGENIYEAIPQAGRYIYPPLLAAIFMPLSKLDQGSAAWMWAAINIFIFVTSVLLGARDVVRRFGIRGGRAAVMAIALLAMILSFTKVLLVVSGGQTDMILVLGVTLGLIYHDRRPWMAGAALALAANIKYTPLVFVFYLLIRRRWMAVVWTVVFFAAFAMVPALVCGWERNLEFWGIALGGVARLFGYEGVELLKGSIGTAQHPLSISLTSAFARALQPSVALAVSGSIALLAGFASWLMYARRSIPLLRPCSRAGPVLTPTEWSGILIAILVFSPQTQGRHLAILLPAYLATAGMLLSPATGVSRRWLIAGLLLAQAAINLPPGGKTFEIAVQWWRSVGGPSWGLLLFWFGLLWTGLQMADALRRASPRSFDSMSNVKIWGCP